MQEASADVVFRQGAVNKYLKFQEGTSSSYVSRHPGATSTEL